MADQSAPPLSAFESRSRASVDGTQSTMEPALHFQAPQDPSSTASSVTLSPPSPSVSFNGRLGHGGNTSELPANDDQSRILQLKREITAAGAELPQRSTDGLFKAVCSPDILFLVDTTSSMWEHIRAAKNQIRSIVKDIGEAFLDEAEVRMAVVGYRDHADVPNIQFLDFTPSADQVRSFLDELTASGGADEPEDVLGGIQKALNATWKHQTRCIIHIADAPPHGRTLHDFSEGRDHYYKTASEPHGLTHQPLIKQMIRLKINYVLLRINHSTDRMAFAFYEQYATASAGCTLLRTNKYYTEASKMSADLHRNPKRRSSSRRSAIAGLLFEEQQLGIKYSELRHIIVKSVTTSASRTAVRLLASPSSTQKAGREKVLDTNLISIDEDEEEAKEETGGMQLETAPPRWNKSHWLNETLVVEGFCPDVSAHEANTLDDMMAHDDNIRMNVVELTVHKRSRPFAHGALRIASYARTAASTDRFVVKSFRQEGKPFTSLAEDMRCQALCKAFALEFNALVGEQHSLDFIVTTCLKGQSKGVPHGECMSLEPMIEGAYTKYSSNCGYVNKDIPGDRFNEAAQAFSHFTFERSRGYFMVCDLQGVGGVLTDPAVHTLDPERFKLGETNLNSEGFKFFFATHTCNSLCSKLGLQSNSRSLTSGSSQLREAWPSVNATVCCSNKLCGRILHLASAKKAPAFPGHHWCEACWPQLRTSRARQTCAAPGAHHGFELCPFFHQSQGRRNPRTCPKHGGTASQAPAADVPSDEPLASEAPAVTGPSCELHTDDVNTDETPSDASVVVGKSLWARLRSARYLTCGIRMPMRKHSQV